MKLRKIFRGCPLELCITEPAKNWNGLRSLSFARDEISVSKLEPLTRTRPFGRIRTFQLDRQSTRAQQGSHSHAEPVVRTHLPPAESPANSVPCRSAELPPDGRRRLR